MGILRLVAILLLIILVIVIGSKVVYKDNFAVIEGTISLDENTSEGISKEEYKYTTKTIDYPSGYTKNNCVVVAFGSVDVNSYDSRGYAFGITGTKGQVAVSLLVGDVPRNASLFSDGIHIWVGNMAGSAKTFKYKIVLMKIN